MLTSDAWHNWHVTGAGAKAAEGVVESGCKSVMCAGKACAANLSLQKMASPGMYVLRFWKKGVHADILFMRERPATIFE